MARSVGVFKRTLYGALRELSKWLVSGNTLTRECLQQLNTFWQFHFLVRQRNHQIHCTQIVPKMITSHLKLTPILESLAHMTEN